MERFPRVQVALTMAVLSVIAPLSARACARAKPMPMAKLVAWSDIIVVGVVRDTDTLICNSGDRPRTIDVEQWIVPADSGSKIVQVLGGNSSRVRCGRRVLLFLAPGVPVLSTRSVGQVIDLQDAQEVAWGLAESNSPWIPYVTSTTSYRSIDPESHPIQGPEPDPVLVEIERILKAARAKTGGR